MSSQQSPVLSPMDTGLWDTIPQQPLLMPQAKQQCAHDAGELEALINRILVDVPRLPIKSVAYSAQFIR